MQIPFNKPFIAGKELQYIQQAVNDGNLAGDGPFTKKCVSWMQEHFSAQKVLLVHSCTAALEIAAILCDFSPGDEVIVPSYTFVSTVNAFVLRGAKPVFCDIRPDTMNLDERQLESLITPRTKAIVPVHYAGVACEMDIIMAIAAKYNLTVIEDAAQGVCSSYNGKALGTIGDFGCYSFHETKNFISGEGGALIINNTAFNERAEIIREKGTNRSKFFRGLVDKYTWVDIGSSYLASELTAAFLFAQLEEADTITRRRHHIWRQYYQQLSPLAAAGKIRLPVIPENCTHNGHMFYILLESLTVRTALIEHLKQKGIMSVFHYVPLHDSPMGKLFHPADKILPVTENISVRLLRLPCYFELADIDIEQIVAEINLFFRSL